MLECRLVRREKLYKFSVRSFRWHWRVVCTKSNYLSENLLHSNFRLVFCRFTFSTYVHQCLQIYTVSNSSLFSCPRCQISKPDKWNPVFKVGRLQVIKNFSFISCHKTYLHKKRCNVFCAVSATDVINFEYVWIRLCDICIELCKTLFIILTSSLLLFFFFPELFCQDRSCLKQLLFAITTYTKSLLINICNNLLFLCSHIWPMTYCRYI